MYKKYLVFDLPKVHADFDSLASLGRHFNIPYSYLMGRVRYQQRLAHGFKSRACRAHMQALVEAGYVRVLDSLQA
ncbi:hypothetical protein [Helicobacter vulpis]|uniref:hypothetical protein n=1 Tax=Helicobacter vulpis TaxID=2316076 RepID=UPI000EAC6DA2|nr:hypothetical protein [Helicobacter vulpis]